jgi:hypothetical protein
MKAATERRNDNFEALRKEVRGPYGKGWRRSQRSLKKERKSFKMKMKL